MSHADAYYREYSSTATTMRTATGSLEANNWACYYYDNLGSWETFIAEIRRTSDEGDPDLYGMWYSPENSGNPHAGEVPSQAYRDFDFHSSSSYLKSYDEVSIDFDELDEFETDPEGVYVCAHAFLGKATNYKVMAATANNKCPMRFSRKDGSLLQCSAPFGATSSTENVPGYCFGRGQSASCSCHAPHTPPNGDVYEGRGFDDCSSTLTELQFPAADAKGVVPTVTHKDVIEAGAWVYYHFFVRDTDYQLNVNVLPEGNSTSLDLFLKSNDPPGARFNEYDYRSFGTGDELNVKFSQDPNKGRPGTNPFSKMIGILNESKFRPGYWYAGVRNDGFEDATVTIEVTKNGKCTLDSKTNAMSCACNDGTLRPDCSSEVAKLVENGEPRTFDMVNSDYLYLELPKPQNPHAEIVLRAKYTGSSRNFKYALPRLIAESREVPATGGGAKVEEIYPSISTKSLDKTMTKQDTEVELVLCSAQLQNHNWAAAVYNPVRTDSIKVTVTAIVNNVCPNDCSGQGECDAKTGRCKCTNGSTQADCSAIGTCEAGTFLQEVVNTDTICWKECVKGKFQDTCASVSCAAGARQQVPGAKTCVKDECNPMLPPFIEGASYVCKAQCLCPLDGNACKMSGACDPSSITCKEGYGKLGGKGICMRGVVPKLNPEGGSFIGAFFHFLVVVAIIAALFAGAYTLAQKYYVNAGGGGGGFGRRASRFGGAGGAGGSAGYEDLATGDF